MRRLFRSFGFAIKGISATIQAERNMKIHFFIALSVIIAGFVLSISEMEWILCILCIGLVFSAELFNTAIEELVNQISLERRPALGRIKDTAAGAVFICAMASVIIGIVIFLPKIIDVFFNIRCD